MLLELEEENPDEEDDAVENGPEVTDDVVVQPTPELCFLDPACFAAVAAAEHLKRVDDSVGAESRETCLGSGGRGGAASWFREGFEDRTPGPPDEMGLP